MKTLDRKGVAVLTCVLTVFGVLMHFAHHLPFFGKGMGLVFPINECPWEHMKMVFFPQVLSCIFLCLKGKNIRYVGGPLLAGTIAIPVQLALFFVYWPFVGKSVLIVDIIAYLLVMALSLPWGVKLSGSAKIQKNWAWLVALGVAVSALIFYWTYHPGSSLLFTITD